MKYLKTLTDADAYQNLRNSTLAVGGSVCTLGGFVADVLQPIAPFANYLFFLSFVSFVALTLLYFRGKKDLLGALVLSGLASGIFGLLSIFQQSDEAQESGVMAANVPAIASLQQTLGIIEEKLDDIKQDTEQIIATTTDIQATTTRLEENSNSMMSTLDEIRDGIGQGGLISNPDTPEEHYHNARVNELSGNYTAARQSYLEYFRSDLPILDPHLRFVSFLRVQEGTAGARETYNIVTENSTSPIPPYVRLLLRDPGQRAQGLNQYLEDHPGFAPAAYHLSLEYSERRLGSQTLSDQRQELKYIKQFQQLDADGGLLRFMVDQQLVNEWREDAETRRLALESSALLENPVSLSWMAHNAGWNGNIQISESAQDIRWNIKGQTQPESTGSSGFNDPTTGRPAPRTFFTLPTNQPQSVIEIRYTDGSGVEQGPFEFTFEPGTVSMDDGQRTLDMTRTAWLSFRDYNGDVLLYFTHLMMYRGSIETIEYGLNTDTPNQNYRFPVWSQPGLAPVDANTPMFMKVDRNTQFATVRLTYKNGQQSPIVRIDR